MPVVAEFNAQKFANRPAAGHICCVNVDIATLGKLYPLDTLQDAHLELLAEKCEVRDLSRNEILFEQGDNDGRTVFLLSGRVVGVYQDGREREFHGDSQTTRYAVGDFQPRRFTARAASTRVRLVTFDRDFLEKVVTWDQISRSPQFTMQDGTAECAQWVFRMLESKALLKLPAGNIERMFDRFDEIEVAPGDTVITEGDEGDFFYVIKEGEFHVIKSEDGHGKLVASLAKGDSFGEDALTSNEPRNATVKSHTAGRLMRLGKEDFGELLRHPVVEWVTPGQASALLELGAELLDVRMKEEHQRSSLNNSINAPLFRLREEVAGKPEATSFVVYCETGERSASAAFILSSLGYRVFALRGGLASVARQLNMIKEESSPVANA